MTNDRPSEDLAQEISDRQFGLWYGWYLSVGGVILLVSGMTEYASKPVAAIILGIFGIAIGQLTFKLLRLAKKHNGN